MEANITKRLHDFWDAGISGPDFVWAAAGPALEAFSRYPAVRRQDAPGKTLSVAEFLRYVRRMVVAFVVGRVLRDDRGERGDLDNLTTSSTAATSASGRRRPGPSSFTPSPATCPTATLPDAAISLPAGAPAVRTRTVSRPAPPAAKRSSSPGTAASPGASGNRRRAALLRRSLTASTG